MSDMPRRTHESVAKVAQRTGNDPGAGSARTTCYVFPRSQRASTTKGWTQSRNKTTHSVQKMWQYFQNFFVVFARWN
jgi:hypothetical protein